MCPSVGPCLAQPKATKVGIYGKVEHVHQLTTATGTDEGWELTYTPWAPMHVGDFKVVRVWVSLKMHKIV